LGIVIFAWRVTWNYAYSPLNKTKYIYSKYPCSSGIWGPRLERWFYIPVYSTLLAQRSEIRDQRFLDYQRDILDKLGFLDILDKLGFLDILGKLGFLDILDKLGFLDILDKLGFLDILDKLGFLDILDKHGFLDKLDFLDILDKLEFLDKIWFLSTR